MYLTALKMRSPKAVVKKTAQNAQQNEDARKCSYETLNLSKGQFFPGSQQGERDPCPLKYATGRNITRNSSGDEIANVNFLCEDIVHAL